VQALAQTSATGYKEIIYRRYVSYFQFDLADSVTALVRDGSPNL